MDKKRLAQFKKLLEARRRELTRVTRRNTQPKTPWCVASSSGRRP